jgi:CHAD domain-containing protein
MSVNVNETEVKYEAPQGVALPRLDGLRQVAGSSVFNSSGPDEEQLEAEYYDTDGLRLIRAGVTLRRRVGGHDDGWHLKLPAGPVTRREIRLPLSYPGDPVPDELAALVRGYTRGKPLRPVARMTTRRQRLTLLGESGQSLAEVAADDVAAQTLGTATTVSRWQELEIELTGGDRRLLKAADDLLRQVGLRPAGRPAKLERALAGQLPEPAGRPKLSRSSPAREVVLAYLREQTKALESLDPMVRRDEPDSVHQMRVATRRLRSTLRSFSQVIPRSGTEQLSGELRWLGTLLGAARDSEVLSGHLRRHLRETPAEQVIGPVQARVRGHFASAGAAARAEMLAALDSERYFALLDELDRLTADPPAGPAVGPAVGPALGPAAGQPAKEVLPAAVGRAYRRARRRMRHARHTPPGRSREIALHEARKAARRARYAGEAAAPVFGKKASRFSKRMKQVQAVLGDHQDAVIARQAARELGMAAHLAGENAFSYGLLFEREAHEGERLQAQARKVWRRASRPRYRRWTRGG